MQNTPCAGCWWLEGGRCYQNKLADVHGLEAAPRGNPIGSGLNGLEITDRLITTCLERKVHKEASAVYGRLAKHLRQKGIEVVFTSELRQPTTQAQETTY